MPMNAAHYDAVVIGSGFGGSLVAHALVQAGLKTALLERGQWAKRDAADWDQRTILLKKRYRSASPLLVKQYGRRTFQRTYPNEVVGGNSVFFGGASLRLRPADFVSWPLSYADLAPYYARAEQLLGVHGEVGTDPHEPPGLTAYPHATVELSAPSPAHLPSGDRPRATTVQDPHWQSTFPTSPGPSVCAASPATGSPARWRPKTTWLPPC